MLKVRDKGKLIAVGYFDKGAEAVMGVLNFFDPAYHSYSPGKFLILHMIHHARASGMKYFYPGSIQVYDDKMDYKMFTGKASIATFLPVEEEWRAYAEWDKQRMEMYFRTHRNRFEE